MALNLRTNPYSSHKAAKNLARASYKSGEALNRHILTAHGGQFEMGCPACLELKRKTEKAREK